MANHPLTHLLRHLRHLAGSGQQSERTDRQLLQCFAARHDEDAFALLVRRHGAMVFGVCRRLLSDSHDAEDAFRATFVLLAQKADSARWQGGAIGDIRCACSMQNVAG